MCGKIQALITLSCFELWPTLVYLCTRSEDHWAYSPFITWCFWLKEKSERQEILYIYISYMHVLDVYACIFSLFQLRELHPFLFFPVTVLAGDRKSSMISTPQTNKTKNRKLDKTKSRSAPFIRKKSTKPSLPRSCPYLNNNGYYLSLHEIQKM